MEAAFARLPSKGAETIMVDAEAARKAERDKTERLGALVTSRSKSINKLGPKIVDKFFVAVNRTMDIENMSPECKQHLFNYALQLSEEVLPVPEDDEYKYTKPLLWALIWLYVQMGSRLAVKFTET